jgi:retron-type reverse transcriptase
MPTDLFHRITGEPGLREAWARVRQGGRAPGLDGVRLEQFDFHADRELARLRRELRAGDYRPYPARRVSLPKEDGGLRAIGIQAVRDRVVQRSLLQALQPRAEPTLEDAAHAYRPRRGVETALARLELFRQRGLEWAVRSRWGKAAK